MFNNIADLISQPKTGLNYIFVASIGSPRDGGGLYSRDASDTATPHNGVTVVVDSDGIRWKLPKNFKLTVNHFGAVGDGVTDDTIALSNARNYIAAQTVKPTLFFPAGIYVYSQSANWGISHARILADGEVRFRYTGAGNALVIDAGSAASTGVYDLTFGSVGNPFIIEANSSSSNGVYVRGVHHSNIAVKSRGASSTGSGLRIEFAVCTSFWNYTCSVNENDASPFLPPMYGIHMTERNAGEACSYCTFYSPIIEGVNVGIYGNSALGNLFLGGTSEGNASYGAWMTQSASNNKFIGMDFEANGEDILDAGYTNDYISCDTAKIAHFTGQARYNSIISGSHSNILIEAPAGRNLVAFVRYNKRSNGAVLADQGSFTRLRDNVNYGLGINQ